MLGLFTAGMGESKCAVRKHEWRVSTRSFVVLLAYTLFIWCLELLDLLAWLLHLPQGTLLSRAAALLLCGVVMKAVGRFEWDRAEVSPLFAAGSVFILVFFAIKGFGPDQSYDTQNYHLLSQIPGFLDNLHYHVIPGRFQMFGFRLGDRMFYPFRLVLGLRMGTLLNALAMLVIYRQVTVFLSRMAQRMAEIQRDPGQKAKNGIWKHSSPVLAFLIVSRLELIQESGSYMVELLALPFLLEMVFLLLRRMEEAKREQEAVLFCLFGGVLFCLKMTNIVYLGPLVLLYLWKIRKYLTPKLFFLCLAIGVIPVSIYLIYNGISMKNPVYPYYNSLFHSPYFGKSDFKDVRWGPENVKEILLWAYSMIRYPDYRLSELPAGNNLDLALMYLGAAGGGIFWFWNCRRKKAEIGEMPEGVCTENAWVEGTLVLFYVSSFFLWAATTGHSRYFMGGLLIAGMICGCLVLRGLCWLSMGRSLKGFAGALFAVLFLCIYAGRAYHSYVSVWNGGEWAMRPVTRASIQSNLPYLFHDHQLFTEEEKARIDRIFLTWADLGSYARLAGEEVPVWNRYSIVNELGEQQDAYIREIEAAMETGEGVYDMIPQGFETLEGYLNWVNEAGWYVNDMEYQETILRGVQSFTLAGLEMAHGRKNRWYVTKSSPQDATQETEKQPEWLWKRMDETDHPVLRAILCDPDYWMIHSPFEVEVVASDGINSRTAAVLQAGQQEYEPIEVQLDLTGLQENIKLELVSTVDLRRAVVINPEWSFGTTEE